MTSKRRAREVALQILFQKTFSPTSEATDLFASFADNFDFDKKTRDYSLYLTESVIEHSEALDQVISSHSDNWRLDRIAPIDRILLQIAIFELTLSTETDTSPKLCMTDIIDLAKKYSSEEAKSFINGILDKVYQDEQ